MQSLKHWCSNLVIDMICFPVFHCMYMLCTTLLQSFLFVDCKYDIKIFFQGFITFGQNLSSCLHVEYSLCHKCHSNSWDSSFKINKTFHFLPKITVSSTFLNCPFYADTKSKYKIVSGTSHFDIVSVMVSRDSPKLVTASLHRHYISVVYNKVGNDWVQEAPKSRKQ